MESTSAGQPRSIRPEVSSFHPEAISFSTGEVVFVLVVLGLMALAVLAFLVLGIVGFHRQGRGRTGSLVAKMAWPIGLIDLGMLLGGIRTSPVVAIPLVVHALAYGIGRARGPLASTETAGPALDEHQLSPNRRPGWPPWQRRPR